VPSARPHNTVRLAVLAICGLLPIGAASGCSTTQEKAERQQARAKHILEARAARRKHQADGPESGPQRNKSAHRPGKGEG
jgi:hypothetical protein